MSRPMTTKQELFFVLFKQAIEAEREAQKLYTEMLNNCEDQELKKVIASFRSDEQKHEKELMDRYAVLHKTMGGE